MSTLSSTGKVPVGGAEIYYEIHGDGPPLVLLHGGVTPSITFGAPLAAMAKTHKVLAIHLRGHGFSTDSDGPWSTEAFADDVAAVLRQLGIGKARFMGYSLGAGVALQVAIRHPQLVEKLVIVSVAFSTEGDYPEGRQAFAQMPANAAAIGLQLSASPLAQLYPDVNDAQDRRDEPARSRLDRGHQDHQGPGSAGLC
jgi:pimeloyl-ACP methyl ester carboxylesterase